MIKPYHDKNLTVLKVRTSSIHILSNRGAGEN